MRPVWLVLRRRGIRLLSFLCLVLLVSAASYSIPPQRGLRQDGEYSDIERMRATPAVVISGLDERWQHTRHVLAALDVTAERITPPKPSLHLAKHLYATYDYDKYANLSDPIHQKYFSLLAAFKHALQHVAHHPDLGPHDFAIVVEDDISLHDDISISDARAAILHGFDLARSDGWMYLGVCAFRCFNDTDKVHEFHGVSFAKCAGLGSHALAFTKSKAATILSEMHTSMKEDFFLRTSQESNDFGQSPDQLLQNYGLHMNGAWTVATNLQPSWYDCRGVLFQDKDRFHSTVDVRRRILRGLSKVLGSN